MLSNVFPKVVIGNHAAASKAMLNWWNVMHLRCSWMFANLALLSVSVTKFCKLLCVMQLRSYGSCQFISVDHLCPQLSWHVTSH